MSLHQRSQIHLYLSVLQKHTETWRAKRRRGAQVNPAANVKIVARMKSMGDGWSLWIGSAMVAVTQRRGGGDFVVRYSQWGQQAAI